MFHNDDKFVFGNQIEIRKRKDHFYMGKMGLWEKLYKHHKITAPTKHSCMVWIEKRCSEIISLSIPFLVQI